MWSGLVIWGNFLCSWVRITILHLTILLFVILDWLAILFHFISSRNILFVHLFLVLFIWLCWVLVVACGTRIKSGPLALEAWGLSYLLGHQGSPSFHLFCWLLVVHFVLHLRSQQSLARGSLPRQPRILETLHPLSLLTAFCCHRLAPAEHYYCC